MDRVAGGDALATDDFLGNVAPDGEPSQVRLYHDFIAVLTPSSRWSVVGTVSVGTQSRSDPSGVTASWYGGAVFARYRPTPTVAIVGRVERYADPDQVIVKTGLTDPLQDERRILRPRRVAAMPRLLWRTEVRGFRSGAAVLPEHQTGRYARGDGFVVTSLALTL